MIIIALTGLKFAGKGTFASIAAAEFGYEVFRTRDQILADAADYGIIKPRSEISIKEMQTIGNSGRAKGGSGYWAERLFDAAQRRGVSRFIMDGVRHPTEIHTLLVRATGSGGRFACVGVEAPTFMRFGRTAGRNEEGDADMRDIEAFLTMDDADRGIGQPWSGQQVDACMSAARALADRTPAIIDEGLWGNRAMTREQGYILRNDKTLESYQDAARNVLAQMKTSARLPVAP